MRRLIRPAGTAGRALLVVWFLMPLVPVAMWSVADRWPFPNILPTAWGLSGWGQAFGADAGGAILRSLLLSLGVAAVATPIGAMAARALTFGKVPGRRLIEIILLAPVAVPPFAIVMGLNVLLLRWRVPGQFGMLLVLVVAAIPYTTYVMRVAYLSHDLAYEQEARTLGASPRAVLWHVHLPLLTPALTVASFLAFLVGWSDYLVTLLVGGGQVITLPMLLGSAASGTGNESVVAVLAVLAIITPLTLFGVTASWRRPRTDRVAADEPEVAPALLGTS